MSEKTRQRNIRRRRLSAALKPDWSAIQQGYAYAPGCGEYRRMLQDGAWHGKADVDIDRLASMADELWAKHELDMKWGFSKK